MNARWFRRLMGCSLLLWAVLLMSGCNTELNRAHSLMEKKDYRQAAQFFEKAMKVDPENYGALRELAQLYCERLKRSIKCLQKSEILNEQFPSDKTIKKWYTKSLYENAVDTFLSKELDKAYAYLKKYDKLDKGNGKVAFLMANITYRKNRKPPFDYDQLKGMIKQYKSANKLTKSTDEIAILNKNDKRIMHYEANMHIGRAYEIFIEKEWAKWRKEQAKKAKQKAAKAKKAAAAGKKRRRRRRRRRRQKKKAEKPPTFKPKAEFFDGAIEAYTNASKLNHPNKFNRALPYIQMGLFHAKFKGQYLKAIKFLLKAKAQDPVNMSAIANIKMLYDRLKERADDAGDKKAARRYELLANKFDSEMASLRSQQ